MSINPSPTFSVMFCPWVFPDMLLGKECEILGIHNHEGEPHMSNLQQDADGNVRMRAIYPKGVRVNVIFTDGTQEEFTGQRLNELREAANAAFRLANSLDAKGFDRNKGKPVARNKIVEFVPIRPGMSTP